MPAILHAVASTDFPGPALKSAFLPHRDDPLQLLPRIRDERAHFQLSGLPQGNCGSAIEQARIPLSNPDAESEWEGLRPLPPGAQW